MIKHIHRFETNADFQAAYNGPQYIEPWLSYTEGEGVGYNKHTVEYNAVDLGLPSGTKWCDRNVGASSPEDLGGYYAWGETSQKSLCDWTTYVYGSGPNNLTKYNSTDGKYILDAVDDAASVNIGPQWKTPTIAQITELTANTTSTSTTLNGVEGRRFTSNINGNSIFIPFAGVRFGRNIDYSDCCCMWSAQLGNTDTAEYLDFDGSAIGIYGFSRCFGLSVRGVRQ